MPQREAVVRGRCQMSCLVKWNSWGQIINVSDSSINHLHPTSWSESKTLQTPVQLESSLGHELAFWWEKSGNSWADDKMSIEDIIHSNILKKLPPREQNEIIYTYLYKIARYLLTFMANFAVEKNLLQITANFFPFWISLLSIILKSVILSKDGDLEVGWLLPLSTVDWNDE